MPLLSILIPTYNRSEELKKNLTIINNAIIKMNYSKQIMIIISDNGSDGKVVQTLQDFIKNYLGNNVLFFHQERNIGFEKNCLFLLEKARTEYVMLLGDDDYISGEYIQEVMEKLRNEKPMVIIPNFYSVDGQGKRIGKNRDVEGVAKKLYKSIDVDKCVLAHQMSGIVFFLPGALKSYKENVKGTVYPQIYFVAYNLQRGNGIYIRQYPLENTVIPQKNFSYKFDNLFGDIARSVDGLEFDTLKHRVMFLKKIADYYKRRYCYKALYLHPFKFWLKVKREYDISTEFQNIIIIKFFSEFLKSGLKKILRG